MYRLIVCIASLLLFSATLKAQTPPAGDKAPASPRTRAESTQYTETSRNADVVSFISALSKQHKDVVSSVLAVTDDGHDVIYMIAARPRISTVHEARKSGRPIVYITANIHAGEVEGKEATLALVRDLLSDTGPNVLDSIVLVVVPNYNTGGNERLGPQARNRDEQRGPELVGTRGNSRKINLNRDYTKADEPETQGFLKFFNEWLPDVYLDLHATNGSYHGYSLTYAAGLHPNTATYTRDVMLPELRKRMKDKHNYATFDYGNFGEYEGLVKLTDTIKPSWSSFSAMPRFGTNYVGLRGRIAILTEAYSHDTFAARVASTRAYISETLSYVAQNAKAIRALSVQNDQPPQHGSLLSVRAVLTTDPRRDSVIAEDIGRLSDPSEVSQTGVPAGFFRTGKFRTVHIPIYDRFNSTLDVKIPSAYLLPQDDTVLRQRLTLHGITVQQMKRDTVLRVEVFIVDYSKTSSQKIEGRQIRSVRGHWVQDSIAVATGAWIVPTNQRDGRLAVYLLEPESEDGFLFWNLLGVPVKEGHPFPVRRVI